MDHAKQLLTSTRGPGGSCYMLIWGSELGLRSRLGFRLGIWKLGGLGFSKQVAVLTLLSCLVFQREDRGHIVRYNTGTSCKMKGGMGG